MGDVVSSLFPSKPKGPGAGEIAAQKNRERAAFEDRTQADKLVALSANRKSRRAALSFGDDRKGSLGG